MDPSCSSVGGEPAADGWSSSNTVEMMDPITSAPELVPHLVGGGWCSEGCGTWEELLPKFLKLLLKYFISKGAGGVDDAFYCFIFFPSTYYLPFVSLPF